MLVLKGSNMEQEKKNLVAEATEKEKKEKRN